MEKIRDETTESKPATELADKPARKKRAWRSREFLRVILIAGLSLVLLISAVTGYLYASSPITMREPLLEHYHFRMQVLVNGKAENFGDAKYQTGYSKDNCNATLPSSPIHFHDNKNQFVHIHWEGVTGGQVLKYYGWNNIGGLHDSLGYRFDELPRLKKVPIHGEVLPAVPNDAKFYVYSGDENGYKERSFTEFTQKDLEVFFDKTSNFPAHELNQQKRKSSLLDSLRASLVPTVSAQGAPASPSNDTGAPENPNSLLHSDTSTTGTVANPTHNHEELKRLNNLIGNVIIFVQKDKPSDQQVKDRFERLEPLSDSTCGG